MKKSFKKSIAILLAVLMIVCAFPVSALADEEKVPNINIQIGAMFADNTSGNHRLYTGTRSSKYTQMGLNTPLDYNNGVITDGAYTYTTGDFITVSVILENVSQLAAAQAAVKYSNNLTPAGVYTTGCLTAASGSPTYAIGEPIAAQSGDKLYNKTQPSILGELSYLDSANKVMYAAFATQDGGDYATSADGQFVLATYMFKITAAGPVTFSLADEESTDDAFYLGTTANGGKEEEYVTFTATENAGSKGLAFMNQDADGNPVNVPTVVEYTITFVDKNGTATSTKYAEGATVTVPELPATVKTATTHTTYAWDVTPATTATADATYTVVGTTANHAWNAGVVTKDPQVGVKGEKTYTCTVCGQTKTEDIDPLPDAHTHSWSAWKYNNDATYTSSSVHSDGTITRTCACGESETKTATGTGLLRANTATVNLGAGVKFIATIDASRTTPFDKVYPVFTFDGKEYPIEASSYNSSTKRYEFGFDKVTPETFAEEIVITMCAEKDGVKYTGHAISYSIKKYATSQLKGTNAKLNTLLVEMLYYGEADRAYRGHQSMYASPIGDLTAAQKALHSTYTPEYVKVTDAKYVVNSGTNETNWVSATMGLEGKVIPKLKFEYNPAKNNINDFVFHVTIAGVKTDITYAERPDAFEATSAKTSGYKSYLLCLDILDADQFREPIDVNITHGGVVVSDTLRYSVESYATGSVVKNNALLKALVDQMLRYGRADRVYTGKTTSYN